MSEHYRVGSNKYNTSSPPWRGAIAIEDISEGLAVPSVVAWTTRGIDPTIPQKIVDGLNRLTWQSIDTAPLDGTYVLLAGPSGYITTPLRVHVGRWFRYGLWITHDNTDFTDDGEAPTLWMPLP